MKRICIRCGAEYEPHNKNRRYCTQECFKETLKHRVTLTCDWCGKDYERIASKAAKGKKHHFCSVDCHRDWMHSLHPPKICPTCKQEFKPASNNPDQIFCTQRCWYDSKIERIEVPCTTCGKPVSVTPFRLEYCKRHFCSVKCRNIGFSGPGGSAWRGGSISKYRGPNWQRQSRRCRKRDNDICQICGAKESESDIAFHTHHRTPFRCFLGDWPRANQLRNLVLLCTACHATVEMALTYNRIDTIPENCRPLKSHRSLLVQQPLLPIEELWPLIDWSPD